MKDRVYFFITFQWTHPGKEVEKELWMIFSWRIDLNLNEVGGGQVGA